MQENWVKKLNKKRFWMPDDFIDLYASSLTIYAQMIYVVLARHADGNGVTFVGLRTIAKKMGVSKTTVTKNFKILEAYHLVVRLDTKNGRASHIQIFTEPNGGRQLGQHMATKEKEYIKKEEKVIKPNNGMRIAAETIRESYPDLYNKFVNQKSTQH